MIKNLLNKLAYKLNEQVVKSTDTRDPNILQACLVVNMIAVALLNTAEEIEK